MSARPRIGEVLIGMGLLTREQLDQALERQRTQGASGRRLGQLLVDLGFVSEVQITKVLSQHLSVPWVSLHHIDFSRQLLNLVPKEIADEFCVIPIYVRHERKVGDTLYLAMEDPTHDDAIRAVVAAAGMPVKSMIAAPSDIRGAIRAFYGQRPSTPAPAREPIATPARAAPPPPPPARPRPPPPPTTPGEPAAVAPAGAPAPPPPVTPSEPVTTATTTSARASEPSTTPVATEPTRTDTTVATAPSAPAPATSADDDDDDAPPDVVFARLSVPPPKPVAQPPAPSVPSAEPQRGTPAAGLAATGLPAMPTGAARARPVGSAASEGLASASKRHAPRMIALTLLDGTTIQIPSQRKRTSTAAAEPEPPPDVENRLTTRDLIAALRGVANGANPEEALGDARWETIVAALLALLLRKQVISDWEFVEELQKA